ncbi:MAG: DUF5103 domain-containing protein [Bacteroidales bacterium]|nr:DUF5103 domain-containing protein [Bacteroidales bacterium]
MKKIAAILFFIIGLCSGSFAQDWSHIELDNMVYAKGIHSTQLCREGFQFSFPIITLNSEEKLQLSFDDLEGDGRYLKYTFIHCSHDWKLDGMNQIEYLEGFMDDEITTYSYSFNTVTPYTHYTLTFPNDIMRITRSGNYILYVYDDSQDQPVLTRRFMVIEHNQAEINGVINKTSDVSKMFSMQEIDFTVNTGSWQIRNPAQYLHATILQNGRWDNAVMGLRYRAGKPGEYDFNYDDNSNIFNGGSEFRVFDTKSLKYNGARIVSTGYKNHENFAYVLEDMARPYGPYISGTTAHGRCYYKTEDFEGQNREEYVRTYFTLRSDYPMTGGKFYVFGELTDWRILPEAQLEYNGSIDSWETTLFLKQGYYNYEYVFVPEGSNLIDETKIEGSHWETGNQYHILLYLQEEGSSYDRLIGYKELKINR